MAQLDDPVVDLEPIRKHIDRHPWDIYATILADYTGGECKFPDTYRYMTSDFGCAVRSTDSV